MIPYGQKFLKIRLSAQLLMLFKMSGNFFFEILLLKWNMTPQSNTFALHPFLKSKFMKKIPRHQKKFHFKSPIFINQYKSN